VTSLLLALASLGWLIAQTLQNAKDAESFHKQLAELEAGNAAAKPAVNTSSKKASTQAVQRALARTLAADLNEEMRRNLNTVIRQLNTPWQDLFDQLERLTPDDIALISIEPDARRRSIKLQAEAKMLDALLVYAAGLEQQGVFGRLTYSKYETNEKDANKPTRLSFELELRTPERLDIAKNHPVDFVASAARPTPAAREKQP
jgi:small-conductance mechanosensitive channel